MSYLDPVRAQINSMAYGFLAILPNLAIAILVMFVAWTISKYAVRIAHRITGHTALRPDLKSLVETLVRLGIWVFGLLIAAAIAIPGFTPAGLVAGLGVGALAIGFAFQDIFENFLAGVLIMLREKMQLGDSIQAEGIEGTVEKITLRETHIRQFTGELTILPNSRIFKNPVKILTDQSERRFQITVSTPYDCDPKCVAAVIKTAVESVSSISRARGVDVFAREFNASSIDFLVRWWVDARKHNSLAVQQEVVLATKDALDGAGISGHSMKN